MSETIIKQYLFVSDFDQTLSFNDSGLVLTELLGIPVDEFKEKVAGMVQLNLVQQGAELAYLLLHDPAFSSRVRRQYLAETGKRLRLKENIELLYRTLRDGIPGYEFDFYVLSAAPVEIVQSALEGIVPARPHLRHRISVRCQRSDRTAHPLHCRLRQGDANHATAG